MKIKKYEQGKQQRILNLGPLIVLAGVGNPYFGHSCFSHSTYFWFDYSASVACYFWCQCFHLLSSSNFRFSLKGAESKWHEWRRYTCNTLCGRKRWRTECNISRWKWYLNIQHGHKPNFFSRKLAIILRKLETLYPAQSGKRTQQSYRILISSCWLTDVRLFDFNWKRGLGLDQSHYNQSRLWCRSEL